MQNKNGSTKFMEQRDTQENNMGNSHTTSIITQNKSGMDKFMEQKDT